MTQAKPVPRRVVVEALGRALRDGLVNLVLDPDLPSPDEDLVTWKFPKSDGGDPEHPERGNLLFGDTIHAGLCGALVPGVLKRYLDFFVSTSASRDADKQREQFFKGIQHRCAYQFKFISSANANKFVTEFSDSPAHISLDEALAKYLEKDIDRDLFLAFVWAEIIGRTFNRSFFGGGSVLFNIRDKEATSKEESGNLTLDMFRAVLHAIGSKHIIFIGNTIPEAYWKIAPKGSLHLTMEKPQAIADNDEKSLPKESASDLQHTRRLLLRFEAKWI